MTMNKKVAEMCIMDQKCSDLYGIIQEIEEMKDVQKCSDFCMLF